MKEVWRIMFGVAGGIVGVGVNSPSRRIGQTFLGYAQTCRQIFPQSQTPAGLPRSQALPVSFFGKTETSPEQSAHLLQQKFGPVANDISLKILPAKQTIPAAKSLVSSTRERTVPVPAIGMEDWSLRGETTRPFDKRRAQNSDSSLVVVRFPVRPLSAIGF